MNFQVEHKMVNKRGELLMQNVIYVLVVIVFFTILMIFVVNSTSNVASLEQKTAKQIALAIDSANPGTQVLINLGDVLKQKRILNNEDVIKIDNENRVVRVLLDDEKGRTGFSYGYFNVVDLDYELNSGSLILKIK